MNDDQNFTILCWEELQGMKQRAEHFLNKPLSSKGERRLAKNVLSLVEWVELEGKANQRQIEKMII